MKRLFFSLFLLLATWPAFAGEVVIPAVYRGAGALGTQWRTEIVVANIAPHTAAPVPTTITFHGDNGQTQEVRMPLSPMETVDVADALASWLGIDSGGGIVRVTWDDVPHARIVARARIYNLGEHGQYGQSMPGVTPSQLVSHQYLTGLTGVDGNRTNVGVSNPNAVAATVFIGLTDQSGAERGGFVVTIPPRSYRQFNDIFASFQSGPLRAATVQVASMNVMVFAYASIVRNDTGDATLVVSP